MAKLDLTYITQLVLEAQQGSSEAFAELYAATYPEQYDFAYRYLSDEYLAQDALQQIYLQTLQELPSLTEPTLFLERLRFTGYRICYMRKRTQSKSSVRLEQTTLAIDGIPYTISSILALPFTEAQILLMRYGDHLPEREIAHQMKLSRRSVRRYQLRGQQRLRKILNVSG